MKITTISEAQNVDFLRNLKNYCCTLFDELEIKPYERLEWLTNEYRDLSEPITDLKGNEEFLNMEVFEVPSIQFWFRDFCKSVPSGVTPRARDESEGRVMALSSILRARDPIGTKHF